MYVTMRSGCLCARTWSARRPSRGVGARRYSSSASARSMRAPARAFDAIASRSMSIKLRRCRPFHDARFSRVAEKRFETCLFVVSEIVLDIVAQVPRADRLPFRIRADVLSRELLRPADARVARPLERLDVGCRQRARPPGPERVDERYPGQFLPGVAESTYFDSAGILMR